MGASKSRRTARAVAASDSARTMVGLAAEQCACLEALLCSKHSAVLPAQLPTLSISALCQLLAPLSRHADLLERWKAALHAACLHVRCAQTFCFLCSSRAVLVSLFRLLVPSRVR